MLIYQGHVVKMILERKYLSQEFSHISPEATSTDAHETAESDALSEFVLLRTTSAHSSCLVNQCFAAVNIRIEMESEQAASAQLSRLPLYEAPGQHWRRPWFCGFERATQTTELHRLLS